MKGRCSLLKAIKSNKGFTLVELIVVMAVLAIISAIAVPRFLGVQEKAKVDADYATGAMIAKAAELYKAKNQEEDSVTASELIDAEYMNAIEFKSNGFKSYTSESVNITFTDNGLAEVVAGTDDQLYPRPPETPTP